MYSHASRHVLSEQRERKHWRCADLDSGLLARRAREVEVPGTQAS